MAFLRELRRCNGLTMATYLQIILYTLINAPKTATIPERITYTKYKE